MQVARQWGWIALRGVLAIAFGVVAFLCPFTAARALALVWGAFTLVSGAVAISFSWRLHKQGILWWPYLVSGALGVLAGLVALAWPGITAIFLLYVIAFWAIAAGVSQIAAAIRLHKEIEGEWWLAVDGLLSIILGALMIFSPLAGVLVVALVIGFYAIVSGILSLVLAFRLRFKRGS